MLSPVTVLLGLYGLTLVVLSRTKRSRTPGDFLLAGRTLTLPAFVATLVTTWYGGILGVGEYAWIYGISSWVVFGLPYYVAALVFGIWLAPRLRRSGAVSIPELLDRAYGPTAARVGALGVWSATIPVAYLLMLATLIQGVTGCSMVTATVLGVTFSALYVGVSGFRAVVRTDALQMALMFGGFALLLPAALSSIGGLATLWHELPPAHRSWDGGLGWQAVLVWYLIAFQTVVEPTFYQRVFAARSPATARTGVLLSVALWAVFDFLSVTTGLAARVILPELADPLRAYPALAETLLAPWPAALFTVALFAIVMSTLDSYLFLAASTFGHDLRSAAANTSDRREIRVGLVVSAVLAALGAVYFSSAIQVWHHVGSVLTSSLLVPLLAIQLPLRWRPSPGAAIAAMLVAACTAVGWIVAGNAGNYPLGLEPVFPALATALAIWLGDRARRTIRSSGEHD